MMNQDGFAALVEGFEALANEREGKAVLRIHKVQLANPGCMQGGEPPERLQWLVVQGLPPELLPPSDRPASLTDPQQPQPAP